jgi:hypothetical protein
MTSTAPWGLIILGFILLLLIGVSAVVGLLGLLFMLIGGVWVYAAAPKCPSCRWPYTLHEVSRTIAARERAFGIVNRVETHSGHVGEQSMGTVIRRQERAPIVRETIRVNYVCSRCKRPAFKEYVQTKEDFSIPPAPSGPGQPHSPVTVNVNQAPAPPPPPLIMRRCGHCGTVYPEARLKCPNCGAAF